MIGLVVWLGWVMLRLIGHTIGPKNGWLYRSYIRPL